MQNRQKSPSDEMPEEDDPFGGRPSKSQRKRDMTALQKTGETLVNAPAERVAKIPLPETLQEAIALCRRIKSHEGRRRQLQYVGRLMRDLDDGQLQAVNAAIEGWNGASRADTLLLHAAERMRDSLLSSDAAVTEFLTRYPDADAQQLRTLIRNAKKESAAGKPPKAYREIFKIVRQLIEAGEKAPDKAAGTEEGEA